MPLLSAIPFFWAKAASRLPGERGLMHRHSSVAVRAQARLRREGEELPLLGGLLMKATGDRRGNLIRVDG